MLKPDAPLPHDHPLEDELALALPDPGATLAALIRRWALRLVPVILLGGAAYVLWREFQHLGVADIAAEVRRWGAGAICAGLGLSALSFLLMAAVEHLGLRWMGARVPLGSTLRGSFLANAIAHSLGANLLVSGAVRARLYERHGVGLTQVAGATLFQAISFATGIALLAGASLVLATPQALSASTISLPVARTGGAVLLSAVGVYLATCALHRTPLHAFGRSLALPSPRHAIGQVALGALDNATAAAIIWILLPHGAVDFLAFIGAFAMACVAGLLSTVPAGAGVFESLMSTLLPGAPKASLAAAFLGYRLGYFILPLAIAVLALASDTLLRRRHRR